MKRFIFFAFLTLIIFTACGREELKVTTDMTPDNAVTVRTPSTSSRDKTTDAIKKSTYLMSQIIDFRDSAKQYCTKSKNELFQNENKEKFLITTIDLPEVQTDLKRILGDETTVKEFTKQVKIFYDANKSGDDMGDLIGVCRKNQNVYVLFAPKGPGYSLTLWKDQKSFEYFRNEQHGIELFGADSGVSSLLIDQLGGKNFILTISKDMPDIYWTVNSLDPENLQSTPIEQCKLTFEFTAKPYFVNTDKSTLSCEKQYKP